MQKRTKEKKLQISQKNKPMKNELEMKTLRLSNFL